MKLPHNADAERAILGGIFLNGESFWDVADRVDPADLYDARHQKIWASFRRVMEQNQDINPITVGEDLQSAGELSDAGGIAYISSLDAAVPPSGNWKAYADIIEEKAALRRVIQQCNELILSANAEDADAAKVATRAQEALLSVGLREKGLGPRPIKAVLGDVWKDLEADYNRQGTIKGFATGFHDFDGMTAGLQREDLVIIAARPSVGKTSMVMQAAVQVARAKVPTLIFSLEMKDRSLIRRALSTEGRVNSDVVRRGTFQDTDWPKLSRAADMLNQLPMEIDHTSGITMAEVFSRARKFKGRHKDIGLVVVDYLQIMGGDFKLSEEQRIARISMGLKNLARDLGCCVVALSQLSRESEKRTDKRPMLSDLRHSGQIEQDADLICFIHRPEIYSKAKDDEGKAEAIIAKQRNGVTGTVHLLWRKEYVRFESVEDGRGHQR